jgi:hypothetical protein
MLIVKIQPGQAPEVFIRASSDAQEDLCLAIWPLVRKHLTALDQDLRRFTEKVLSGEDQVAAS